MCTTIGGGSFIIPRMNNLYYDLRDLRAVCEIGHCGSFVRAAELLSITPSALSRRVARLEEAVGGLLVSRTTRGAVLTPLGRKTVARAEGLVASLDECMASSSNVAKGLEGELTVGCISSLGFSLFPLAVAKFKDKYPDIRLSVMDDDGTKITAAVMERKIEFALTTFAPPSGELLLEQVATDPFVLVCHPTHALARRKAVTWRELASHRLLGLRPASSIRQQIDGTLRKVDIELQWFDAVDQLSSLVGHLRSGRFVGVLPKLLHPYVGDLAMRLLTAPQIERRVYLIRRRDSPLSAAGEMLWREIRNCVTPSHKKAVPKPRK